MTAPTPLRAASSSTGMRNTGTTPTLTLMIGLRLSTSLANEEKTPNEGFLCPSRSSRPLCHVLVGSSRRMNQMKIWTR
jgi:hypothetical protein